MNFQHAIVVGGTSGIGLELVKQLAEAGCRVAAIGRNQQVLNQFEQEYPHRVYGFHHDVSDWEMVPELFAAVTEKLGGLDLFVYSAGVMPSMGWGEYSTEKDRLMIETNVSGMVAWGNEAARRFEGTKRGSWVVLGSVAGERGRGMQPVYNATKAFAVTYAESIRNRLARYGVAVVTIKPGPTDTPMTAGLGIKKMMSAEVAAAKIIKKSGRSGEYFLSPVHALIFAVLRNIPSLLFRKLKI
jgi:decaprenylphospho-beta-D-erythro-pentofuranosid-2-ulose 2-reductase